MSSSPPVTRACSSSGERRTDWQTDCNLLKRHIPLTIASVVFAALFLASAVQAADEPTPIAIGSRRELFVDRLLAGEMRDPLAGKPVKLRFEMSDADLISIRFR